MSRQHITLMAIFCFATALIFSAAVHVSGEEVELPKDSESPSSFYGLVPVGKKIVYVVDNSNSMKNRVRFDAAAQELIKSVGQLSDDQMFSVVLFSDTAYPLFHPQAAKGYVKPTDENRRKLQYWLDSVELCLKTNAAPALNRAMAMKPDTIYLLTDGAFTDDTYPRLMKMQQQGPTIHTIGLEVGGGKKGTANAKGKGSEANLKAIAKKFNGQYRYVDVPEKDQKRFAYRKRKTNNQRGAVWGLALPDKNAQPDKKKKKN